MKYGPHLTLDLIGCNPKKTSDIRYMFKFMGELPGKIGMNKMGEPHIDMYNGIHEEWFGASISIHIQESHMTVHAFDWGYVFIDIFSCKDFDTDGAIKYIMESLEADQHKPSFFDPNSESSIKAMEFIEGKKSSHQIFERGLNFPPSLK